MNTTEPLKATMRRHSAAIGHHLIDETTGKAFYRCAFCPREVVYYSHLRKTGSGRLTSENRTEVKHK